MSDKEYYKAMLKQGFNKNSIESELDLSGFEIIKELGQGGMSKVYLAFDKSLNRRVAIKVFQTGSLDASARERFRQEAYILARLRHPNTISVHNVNHEGKKPYMILEYISGGDLRSLLAREKKLPLSKTLPIVIDICKGLEALHAEFIVHRDINPSNILLTDKRQAIIADLGIALNKHPEANSATHTVTGTFVGTMTYLAPEQMSVSRENIDGRADIWAVGVLLFEILVGQTPQALLVSDLLKEMPLKTRPILKKCLRRNPEDRYSKISELRQDLESIASPSGTKKNLLITLLIAAISVAFLFFYTGQPASNSTKPSLTPKTIKNQPPTSNSLPSINLLNSLSIQDQASRGSWDMYDGTLRCHPYALGAYLAISSDVINHNYDLSLTIKREWGKNSIVFYLPTDSGIVNLDIDGWQKHLSGIQNIDGKDMINHGEHFHFRLTNNETYRLLIEVRSRKIAVHINGNKMHEWNIEGKKLSLRDLWSAPISKKIGLGAWNSRAKFRDIKLNYITD